MRHYPNLVSVSFRCSQGRIVAHFGPKMGRRLIELFAVDAAPERHLQCPACQEQRIVIGLASLVASNPVRVERTEG